MIKESIEFVVESGKLAFELIKQLYELGEFAHEELKDDKKHDNTKDNHQHDKVENKKPQEEDLSPARKFWGGVKNFLTSRNFSIIASLACAALIFVSPVAPWLAGIAVALTVTAIVAGVAYETYKRYNIRQMQKEDKLLREIADIEKGKLNQLKELATAIENIKDPALKTQYIEAFSKLVAEHFNNKGIGEFVKAEPQKALPFLKALFSNTPEAAAGLIGAAFTLNPAAYVLAASNVLLTYTKNARANVKFENNRAELEARITNQRRMLGIPKTRAGSDKIKELAEIHDRQIGEDIYLKHDVKHLLEAIGKKESPESALNKARSGREIDRDITPRVIKSPTLERVKEVFMTLGQVLLYGFNSATYERKMDPLAKLYKSEGHKTSLDDLNSSIKDMQKQRDELTAQAEQYNKAHQRSVVRDNHHFQDLVKHAQPTRSASNTKLLKNPFEL